MIEKDSCPRVTHCLKVDRTVLFIIEVGDMVMSGFLDFKMGVFHRPDAVEEFLGDAVELFFGRGKLTMDAK